jgi:lysophospholipase L1-like esterase
MPIKKDWSPMLRSISLPLAFLVVLGSFVLLADGRKDGIVARRPDAERVLYIGDSLTVGKFGEFIGEYLVRKFSQENVALYASCGASPENWIQNGISYETRCGWREMTIKRSRMGDPMRHDTPMLEELVTQFQPTMIIVQLGTNWMDRLTLKPAKEVEIRSYMQEFLVVAHRPPVRRVIWITPPDSSRYSRRVQEKVAEILRNCSRGEKGFEIIDSRPMTRYELGKTGGDGVHYRSKAAWEWAEKVKAELRKKKVVP